MLLNGGPFISVSTFSSNRVFHEVKGNIADKVIRYLEDDILVNGVHELLKLSVLFLLG